MKTVIKLDVSDDARRALASLIAGKPVARLATRNEVTLYVQGIVSRLDAGPAAVLIDQPVAAGEGVQRAVGPAPSMTPWEEAEYARLIKLGRSEAYAIGWLRAGRTLGRNS